MNWKSLSKRTVAYIILKVSGTLGGGFIMGIEIWQAAAMAGFIGLMEVMEEVSRAYVVDGEVDESDMNEIFGEFSHKDEDPDLG